jgi:hypothetical protein
VLLEMPILFSNPVTALRIERAPPLPLRRKLRATPQRLEPLFILSLGSKRHQSEGF